MTDLHDTDGTMEAFGNCLRQLSNDSRPENRAADHLLRLDLNDTWRFAYQNRQALSVTNAA